jgi:signal transduction histidine kinase
MNKIIEKWETEENPDIVLKVREAQIQQLYGQTWGGLIGIMIIMSSACIALWQVVPHWKLLLWSGALVLLSIARGIHTAVFQRKAPSGHDIYRWARQHVIGVIASGIMWALPSIFLWPGNSPVHQLIWPIYMVALAVSAVAKYCTWTPAYLPYLILTMAPISVRLLTEGGLVHTVLGLMGFVFTAILAQTGKLMHNANLRALVMGIHNEALSSFLSAEKEKEEDLNAQLQQEIAERARSQEELRLQNQELERLNAQLTATKDNLESANKELEQALINIKQLSGMLPICASCKKIRNDKGYWEQIEAYFQDHSEVEFSHSICPECVEKLYPGIFQEK